MEKQGRSKKSVRFLLFFLLPLMAVLVSIIFSSCTGAMVRVGYVGALTGPSSAVGLGARNGVLMALGDGPGSVSMRLPRFTLSIKDDGGDPYRCLSEVQALAQEGVRIIILCSTSQTAAFAIPWAISNGILVVSPTVSDPQFSGKDDLFLRVNESSDVYGRELAKLILSRYEYRSVGLLGDNRNEAYRKAVASSFKEAFSASDRAVCFDYAFDSRSGVSESELREMLDQDKPDALVIICASSEAVSIAKYVEKGAYALPLFFPPWPLTLDLLKTGGTAVEGGVGISIADLDFTIGNGRPFKKAYLEEYGEAPSFTSQFGWEAASILVAGLGLAKSGSPDAVKRAILKKGTFEGVQGAISFDQFGDASRTLYLFHIEDGHFVRLP